MTTAKTSKGRSTARKAPVKAAENSAADDQEQVTAGTAEQATEDTAPQAAEAAPTTDETKAKEGPSQDGETAAAEAATVTLEVSTRLPRRIRAGVVVTREKRVVEVSPEDAARIEADPHISAVRK